MSFRDAPIRRKLMTVMLLTGSVVLFLTSTTFITYELLTFRQGMVKAMTTLGEVIATNSTAALAFDNADDARDVLAALKAEPHITAAGLYDSQGHLFAKYPASLADNALPASPGEDGYRFASGSLIGLQPVRQHDNKRLGSLYVESDLGAFYEKLGVYSEAAILMIAMSLLVAYFLSRILQRQISRPIFALVDVARAISEAGDYSMRAQTMGRDELGQLTDAFNRMLAKIEEQTRNLTDSETRVRAVMNSALSAVIVIDAAGRVAEWNLRAETLFGWTRDEALGRDLSESVVPPRLREQHRHALKHFSATGEGPLLNRSFETSALRRDGSEFPVELSISPLKTGDTLTFCGFVTDITERKEAESRVQAQLSRLSLLHRITRAIGERQDLPSIFQVLIRSLEDSLAIDFGCVCLYDAGAQMLTVASAGARGLQTAMQLSMVQGAQLPIDRNGLSRCVQGQLVYEPDIAKVPFPFCQRLTQVGLGSAVFAPLAVESKVFGVLIATRHKVLGFSSPDCEFLRQLSEHAALATHQAQLYTALQQAYDDLRQTQHAILQQERLRALGQMASGIAHDINNAISPVALYTESLLETEPNLSATARRYLETIQRAVDDVAQTVTRMREFYRHRDAELTLAPVQLNLIVPQVVDLTRARWSDMPQQRGISIELRTELMPTLPPFMGVESEIREALINLIFNAVDAMPDSGTLTLRTGVVDDAPCRVYIDVIDSGVGMDEDTRRRCLEPFFTTKGERGTGLGLAMVYGMVQRHSADIEIESAPGKGTRMRLVFLVMTQELVSPVQAMLPARPRQRLRILVIDDDPMVLNSLRDTLGSDGHIVTVADGGQKGIDEFIAARQQGEPYSVVITDLGMPYVDGRKVAVAIKAASPTTPIIMLTGWGQRLVAENDVPPQVDRVLNKPPRLQELRETLADCCKPASQG